jgi:hypothetical protein
VDGGGPVVVDDATVAVFSALNAVPEASYQYADDACRSYSVFANLSYISIEWEEGDHSTQGLLIIPENNKDGRRVKTTH